MLKKILSSATFFICVFILAQVKYTYGDYFNVQLSDEKDMKLAISDDYNVYLFSVIPKDGVMFGQILARKFDQKGNLLDVIVKDYKGTQVGTFVSYLGSQEIDNNRFVVYTEEVAAKENRKEVFQHVFNRKTNDFTTTSVAKYKIESNNKSGSTYVKFSENKKYVAIINDRFSNKKTGNIVDNLVIDLRTLSNVWEKAITLDDDFVETNFTITNSARIITFRKSSGWNRAYKLMMYSDKEEKDIPLEDKLVLNDLYAISINDQDYLISFGYFDVARVGQGEFNRIVYVNLQSGKNVVNRTEIFGSNINISDIIIRKVVVKDRKLAIFAEQETKFIPTATSSDPFPKSVYSYGPAYILKLNDAGELDSISKFSDKKNNVGKISIFEKDSDVFIGMTYYGDFDLYQYSYKDFTNRASLINFPEDPNFRRINGGDQSGGVYSPELSYYIPSANRLINIRKNNGKMSIRNTYNLIE